MSSEESSEKKYWKKKLEEHWKALAIAITGAIVAFIGAFLVLVWFISISPIGLQGTATIDLWTLDWVVGFLVQYTLWALLFIGVPLALFFGLGGYLWWRNLPEEERKELKERGKTDRIKRKTKYSGSGGGGLIMFIGYCLYHLIKGTNDVQFGNVLYPYTYWIYTWFETLMWMFIVLGIPLLLDGTIYYFVKVRKKSE